MNTPTGNTKSTKAVEGVSPTAVNDPADVKDPEFEAALAGKDGTLSAKEQAELDKLLGDHDEHPDEAPGTETPSQLEALEAFSKNEEAPMKVITKLVQSYNADTPNEYIIGGTAVIRLKLGHLRALIAKK